MARKAAWEDLADADLGPYAKARGTNWARVFSTLLVVVAATFVVAYYLPLYRAHQRLGEQYRELSQKSQSLSDSASKTSMELKTASDQRAALQAEHDQEESAKKSAAEQQERVRAALNVKLDKLVKKNSAAVVLNAGSLFVALDSALLFQPQKLDLTPTARTVLCDVVKAGEAKSWVVRDSLSEGAAVPPALAKLYPSPFAYSAARAAAVAQGLQEGCAVPAAQLSATGSGTRDPLAGRLGSFASPADHIELELRREP